MNVDTPYTPFETADLTLRDVLAVDRTAAANERTMLGYVRTSLALFAAGGSLLHFVAAPWAAAVGMALVGAGFPVLAVGWWRYQARRQALLPLLCAVDSGCLDEEPAAALSGVRR